MPHFTTKATDKNERIQLYFEDYGEGQPIVLVHGWPLSHKMWEYQVPVLAEAGFRVISYDRRGFGESDRPWNGYDYDSMASDLNELIDHLDLNDVILVGFSMGGGEVARYLGNYGSSKIAKAVFVSSVVPFMLKTENNPEGVDQSVFDGMKEGIEKDRPGFMKDFGKNFVAFEENQDRISEAQVEFNWNIACHASQKATLDCVDAFSSTDFREDCKKINVPTLIVHGDNDAIVPMEKSGQRAAKLISNAEFKILKGAPHGLMMTHKDELNKILLDFLMD